MKIISTITKSILLLSLVATFPVFSKGGASRSMKKIGLSAGIFSPAFPAFSSYGLHFNLTSRIQLAAGYGAFNFSDPLTPTTKIGVTSYGVGANFFLLDWSLSPFVGFNYMRTKADGAFTLFGSDFNFSGTRTTMYASVGIDHQSQIGFNFGLGAHYMIAPSEIKSVLPLVPFLYVGWYF